METIGLIGAGLAGSAMAERFLAAGFAVSGFDVDAARRAALAALGGTPAASAREVARSCRRIVLSLPTSAVTEGLLDDIESSLGPGTLVLDTTTGAPDEIASFGPRLAAHGVEYLDATVGGSSAQIRSRDAIAICGGTADAFAAAADLLGCFARRSFHAGPYGSGARMKLVLNLALGLNRAVLGEALGFASACGLDPTAALEILKAGPAYSRAMDVKGAKMLARDFTPEARLSQHLKDVRLILAEGTRHGGVLPLSALHREILESLEAAGHGGDDNSAVALYFKPEE